MINIVYKDICQQIVSQHYSTFLFQKSFYCFETGISLFFFLSMNTNLSCILHEVIWEFSSSNY